MQNNKFQVLIYDDVSTDRIEEIIREYEVGIHILLILFMKNKISELKELEVQEYLFNQVQSENI